MLSPLVPGEIGVGWRGGIGVAKFRWQLIGGVPFTASLPAAAATATATGGTLVGAGGTLLTCGGWVKRDGTIQRVWLLSMTRPSLVDFNPYRFLLLPEGLLAMYLVGWTGTVWTTSLLPWDSDTLLVTLPTSMVDAMSELGGWNASHQTWTARIPLLSVPKWKCGTRSGVRIRARIMALLVKSLVILLGDRTSGRDGEVPSVP